jgi:hypothetical protein
VHAHIIAYNQAACQPTSSKRWDAVSPIKTRLPRVALHHGSKGLWRRATSLATSLAYSSVSRDPLPGLKELHLHAIEPTKASHRHQRSVNMFEILAPEPEISASHEAGTATSSAPRCLSRLQFPKPTSDVLHIQQGSTQRMASVVRGRNSEAHHFNWLQGTGLVCGFPA